MHDHVVSWYVGKHSKIIKIVEQEKGSGGGGGGPLTVLTWVVRALFSRVGCEAGQVAELCLYLRKRIPGGANSLRKSPKAGRAWDI